MQDTPKGTRLHIAIFGRRNAGKSSLINALTNQEIALVSDVPGTTTDPVYKAMEILPIGPVMLIDTAGIDDEGVLGEMRVKKTYDILNKADIVIIVVDVTDTFGEYEQKIVDLCNEKEIPCVIVYNKTDLVDDVNIVPQQKKDFPQIFVSTVSKQGISELKQELIKIKPSDWLAPAIVGDILEKGDMVVLVVPIDTSAPKGRLILPQVQTIRDILDHDCMTVVCKEYELKKALQSLTKPPKLVVTDSQVFMKVAADTPEDVWLTSFSILMARYKGDLLTLSKGAKEVDELRPGDKVLISEACTHHLQCDDIGRVKIPRWLRQIVGGDLKFEFTSGGQFPTNMEEYKLVVHCGGCMLNRREMISRVKKVEAAGIPIVNYGVLIAYIHGILPRTLAPFGIDIEAL